MNNSFGTKYNEILNEISSNNVFNSNINESLFGIGFGKHRGNLDQEEKDANEIIKRRQRLEKEKGRKLNSVEIKQLQDDIFVERFTDIMREANFTRSKNSKVIFFGYLDKTNIRIAIELVLSKNIIKIYRKAKDGKLYKITDDRGKSLTFGFDQNDQSLEKDINKFLDETIGSHINFLANSKFKDDDEEEGLDDEKGEEIPDENKNKNDDTVLDNDKKEEDEDNDEDDSNSVSTNTENKSSVAKPSNSKSNNTRKTIKVDASNW